MTEKENTMTVAVVPENMITLIQAAALVGVGPNAIRYHVNIGKRIRKTYVGNKMYISKSDLLDVYPVSGEGAIKGVITPVTNTLMDGYVTVKEATTIADVSSTAILYHIKKKNLGITRANHRVLVNLEDLMALYFPEEVEEPKRTLESLKGSASLAPKLKLVEAGVYNNLFNTYIGPEWNNKSVNDILVDLLGKMKEAA